MDGSWISGGDYISSSYSSFVQFQYDQGNGLVVIESRGVLNLNDNDWYTIEALRTGRSGVLIVNGIISRGHHLRQTIYCNLVILCI